MSFGVEVPDAHGVIVAGGEEGVVFGVECEVGDGVGVSFEHFDDSVFVDGPVEDEVVFFCGDEDGTVVVGVAELLDLVVFHEEFSVALGVGGEEDVEGGGVGDVEDLAVVGEVEAYYVFAVLFYYFGGFEALEEF